jgi:hypothetical protein
MTTATVDTDRLKSGVDLRDLAGRLTTLRRESARELSGPCPKCGGSDRFHVAEGMAFCRQCWPLDRTPPAHDAIGFVQWAGLAHDFRSAVEYLDAGAFPAPTTRPTPAAHEKAHAWRAASWQAEARRDLAAAQARLHDPAVGGPGRRYLLSRWILPATWAAWGLGYGMAWDSKLRSERPAICIPWQRERITALKWRFLEVPAEGLRYTSKAGGECIVFGLGLAGAHGGTLWAVEGEINALSLWQALRSVGVVNADVVSFGSESGAVSETLRTLAGRYGQVIVWADDPRATTGALVAIPGAFGLRSPDVDGRKMDANALLCAGGLEVFALAAWAKADLEGFAWFGDLPDDSGNTHSVKATGAPE